MLAATAVLVSHAYPLALGEGTPEPLQKTLGFTLGSVAVWTFFSVSGYFISQSFDRCESVFDFCAARFLRIYPGLFTVLVITVVVIGPLTTSVDLASFFLNRSTYLYVPQNLTLKWLEYDLPGVFRNNPYQSIINGSLWTLFYEVACYALAAIVGTVCVEWKSFGIFITIYVCGYLIFDFWGAQAYLTNSATLRNLHEMSFPFVLGMVFFRFIDRNNFRLWVLLAVAAVAYFSYQTLWFSECFILAWSYGVFYVGFRALPIWKEYNRVGDYSYGIYIYGFPVEQIVASIRTGCSALQLTAWALPLTIACAVISWRLVERPALAQRRWVVCWGQAFLQRTLGWVPFRSGTRA